MYILGLQIAHSSTAALIKDEKIIGAISEERLTRKKCHFGFPILSIKKLLEIGKINGEDISIVTIASKELDVSNKKIHSEIFKYALGKEYEKIASKTKYNISETIKLILKNLNINSEFKFYEHHLAHSASAYYTCEFSDPLIITSDGHGDGYCNTANIIENNSIKRIDAVHKFYSAGRFYSFITVIEGFKPLRHEGKITGLAAYGDSSKLINKFRYFLKYNIKTNKFSSKFIEDCERKKILLKSTTAVKYLLGKVNNLSWIDQYYIAELKKITKGYSKEDIAAAAQLLIEEVTIDYVKYWLSKTKKKNVILAGGLFANVKLNQYIHEISDVENIYIHPGMGDEGLALGSAYLALKEKKENIQRKNLENVYFSEEFNEKNIEKILNEPENTKKYQYEKLSSPKLAKIVASYIEQGKIIGLFTKKMEYGPRALGARTVMADPRDKSINDWLNKRFKRTEFMPFAPVVMEEYANLVFENIKGAEYTAEFMTITFDVKPEWTKKISAVSHVDNTARPQILKKKTNPLYYSIINEYYKITGIPLTINTSFNMHEEPIIDSPKTALRALDTGAIDYIVMENYIVKNK